MKYLACFIISLFSTTVSSQQYADYQLRLEPVWARVADALGEYGSVESVEFSPNGRFIVSGTKYDNSVIMWRTSDGQELWRQYTAQEVERVAWSPDNQYVAACSEDQLVTIYDAASGEVRLRLAHEAGIDGLTWATQSNILVSGEEEIKRADGSKKGWIRFFEIPSGREIRKIDFGGTINELFFSSDDRFLMAAGHGAVKVYDGKDGQLLQTLKPNNFFKFVTGSFSPDAKHIIAGGFGGTMYLWEWESGKLLNSFNHTGKKVETVSWHPNGHYIAMTGHEPYIRIYRAKDIIEYENDRIPVAHQRWSGDHAEYIDFNADGSFLVSAHQNGLIKLWTWMGEDPALNEKLHSKIKKVQEAAKKDTKN